MKDGAEAKFWVAPEVKLARSNGIDARTLRRLTRLIEDRADYIERVWYEHFG